MNIIKALKNTKFSSCFVESDDNEVCFHYYKGSFYLNDGTILNIDDNKVCSYLSEKSYHIKYKVREIDYDKLEDLHDKLNHNEFDKENDSFLSVYDKYESKFNQVLSNAISAVNSNTQEELEKNDIIEKDSYFYYLTKAFIDASKKPVIFNYVTYIVSYVLFIICSILFYVYGENLGLIQYIILLLSLFGICVFNDDFERGDTLQVIIKFLFSIIVITSNALWLMMDNIFIFVIFTIILFFAHMKLLSDRARVLTKTILLFDIEAYK